MDGRINGVNPSGADVRAGRGVPAMTTIAGLDSPADADALALTFAQPVAHGPRRAPAVARGHSRIAARPPARAGRWDSDRTRPRVAAARRR